MAVDKHLFLIGMQGCGKSSLGKRTAKETGVPFADTDVMVAQSAGGTVNEFFEKYGEETFRRAETNALAALTYARPMIISGRRHGAEPGEPPYHAVLGHDCAD